MSQNTFTTQALVAWLETQPAERRYCYLDTDGCLIHQYLTARGIPLLEENAVGGCTWDDASGREHVLPKDFARIAAEQPHTYGAALKRARALLPNVNTLQDEGC